MVPTERSLLGCGTKVGAAEVLEVVGPLNSGVDDILVDDVRLEQRNLECEPATVWKCELVVVRGIVRGGCRLTVNSGEGRERLS